MADEKKPFKVTISDEDYLSSDEMDSLLDELNNRKNEDSAKRFEVHIDDIEYEKSGIDDIKLENRGEIYFSNVKPIKNEQNTKTPSKGKGKKKKKASQGALALFIAVAIIFSASFSVWGISCINDVVGFTRGDDTVTVTIPNEANTNDIIDILADSGLIKQKFFCKLFYELMFTIKNLNKENKTEPVYLSGVYYVTKDMGLEGFLYEFREMQQGKETIRVTIPEGWCTYQIFDRLEKFGVCSKSRLVSSIKSTDFEYDFIKDISDDSSRTFKIEGYLYPNTYDFYVDSDPNSVIRKLLDESDNQWTDEYQKQADKLGKTRDEIMIIASIIQREAANTEQMGLISSVIHNRLNHSVSWPLLGCDSTTTYINTYVGPNVNSSQKLMFESKYDTYSIKGLPPGPICNPGDDAINAALYPESTSYYFFRHDKYGKIYMARTQAEHDANANVVLRANSR